MYKYVHKVPNQTITERHKYRKEGKTNLYPLNDKVEHNDYGIL